MIVKRLSSPPKNEKAKDEENVASTFGQGGALIYMLCGEQGRVMGYGASFQATSHKEFIENYVLDNLSKVQLK